MASPSRDTATRNDAGLTRIHLAGALPEVAPRKAIHHALKAAKLLDAV